MQGRKRVPILENVTKEILRLRAKGMGPLEISQQVPLPIEKIRLILYPQRRVTQSESMMKRYYRLKRKGLCHQCGQPKK